MTHLRIHIYAFYIQLYIKYAYFMYSINIEQINVHILQNICIF